MSVYKENFLKGKNVFVAGGTSGINLTIAERFAVAGASVAVMSRNPEKVAAAVDHIKQAGGDAVLGFSADVREFEAVNNALQETAKAHGPLDVVVSGAAGNFLSPAENLSSNAFKTVVEIDLIGTFNVLRAAYDVSRRPGASFINISAPQASVPFWGQAHVCSAKAGIDMLTQALAYEWGAQGIRVNAIVPGPIEDTEGMERLAANDALKNAVTRSVPMRRYGTRNEIADMALFLASDAAAYVNGGIHFCDGGQTISGGSTLHPDNFS